MRFATSRTDPFTVVVPPRMSIDKPVLHSQPKKSREWNWWTATAAFVFGTVVFLVVFDAIYAPKAYKPTVLPDAAGN